MKGWTLITGASSPIARQLAELLAADDTSLILAGRDTTDLQRSAADLRVRFGVDTLVVRFDADDPSSATLFADCVQRCGGHIDRVVICHGTLIENNNVAAAPNAADEMMQVNFTSAVWVMEPAAAHFEAAGSGGMIVAVSSVAGDRARKSNYLYGASKAALDFYLAGLRHRLARSAVHVLTVKPGFVDTKMIWGKPGTFLVARPATVARDIAKAMRRRRQIIYTPWFWRLIMLVMRLIPGPVFRRLKFDA